MDLADKTVLMSIMLYVVVKSTSASCPLYQVPHNISGNTVCCKPVFGCLQGHEVVFCTVDGGQDECKQCKDGSVNWYNTSSVDTDRRKCFPLSKPHSDSCPADTHPTAEKEYCDHMRCKCQFEMCFYGDPCVGCLLQIPECSVNEEMDGFTGKCKPCKAMMNSPGGCAACQYNETAWRISQENKNENEIDSGVTSTEKPVISPGYTVIPDTPSSSNKTDALETDKEKTKTDDIVVPVIIVIVVLVVCGILIACFLYAKKKASSGDNSSFPAVVYTRICTRRQDYTTDAESLATNGRAPATTNGGAPPKTNGEATLTTNGEVEYQNVVSKPTVATVSPMVQGASGTDDDVTDASRMDLLKNETEAQCGAEGDTVDLKQVKGED